MAPKSKASAKSLAGGKKGVKKDGNCVKSASAVSKKAKEDRDIQIKATRTLKKFVGFSHEQVHGIKVNNKSLWETIVYIYEQGSKRISPGKILSLRTSFQGQSGGFQVSPQAADEIRSQRLVRVIALSIVQDNAIRDRPALYSYLALVSTIKEGDFCAVLNSITGLNVMAAGQDLSHCLEVLKIIISREWHTKFASVWSVVKPFFLQCVVLSLSSKLLKECPASIVSDHRDMLGWANDVGKLDQIYATGEQAIEQTRKFQMMSDLVATGCPLAEILFSSDLGTQSFETFKQKVKALIDALLQNFTDNKLADTQAKCFEVAEDFADKIDEAFSWNCELVHGSITLEIPCKDTFRHCELQIANVIRLKAVGFKDGLDVLLPQTWMGEGPTETPVPIASKWFKDAAAGRKLFNTALKQSAKVDGLEISAWASLRVKVMEEKDRCWAIDHALIQKLYEVKGPQKLKDSGLKLLPSVTDDVELNDCITKLNELEQTQLYTFVPEQFRGPVMSSFGLLNRMQKGKITREQFAAFSGFDKTVADKLQFFARVQGKVGTDALQIMMKAARDQPEAPDRGDRVAHILMFKFMITAEEQEEFEAVAQTCVVVSAGIKSQPVMAHKRSKKGADDKSQMELAMEAANNMFG